MERAGGATALPLSGVVAQAKGARHTHVPGPFVPCPDYLFRLAQNSSNERRLSLSVSFAPITASATVSVT